MESINKRSLRQKWASYRRSPLSLVLFLLVSLAALLTMLVFLFLVGYILVKGIPHLKPSLFAWHYTSENVSMTPAIVNTVTMTLSALLIAVPLGDLSDRICKTRQ